MHKWKRVPDTKEIGIGTIKHWVCVKCKCEKHLGVYKFATPDYSRSGQIYSQYTPNCVDMDRRSQQTID